LPLSSLLPRLWTNWITLLGSVITTISGFALVTLLVIGLVTENANPYLNLVVLIVLPAMFGFGLLLIPIGLRLDRRTQDRPPDSLQAAFKAAFEDPSARRRVLFVALATVANIGIFALAGHKMMVHMATPQFCGTSCHAVMQPEWDAYNISPHSNVACVECHIGAGTAAHVKAKWNGLHQLVGVITTRYDRPVVAGTHDLVAAQETCQKCHAPERFRRDRIKLFAHYSLDKDNTPKFNAMLMRLGGKNPKTHKWEGVHWHANPDNQVRFEILDDARSKVGKVTLLSKGQLVAEYLPKDASQKPVGMRTMDCVDCHNRPAHLSDFTAKAAVDRALFAGALDPKTPFIAQVSVELLGNTSAPREGAEARFKGELAAAYQREHPEAKVEAAVLDKAAGTLAALYLQNVYPDLKQGWGVRRSDLGHNAEGLTNPGCFRCHDGQHAATLADGRKKKIGQDCDSCHTGLAFDQDPAKFDDTLAAMMPAEE